jgi:hypothetical protein
VFRIRTESGRDRPEAQPEIVRLFNEPNHDPLNLWQSLLAPGSDTR